MVIRVLLADDHKIVRDGLRSLLEKNGGLQVVGEAYNGQVAVELANTLLPDVVVMDIGMPIMNGIEATEQIIENQSDAKVLGLSMHCDRRFVSSMLEAGASGYLLKDCAFDELVDAIHMVFSGHDIWERASRKTKSTERLLRSNSCSGISKCKIRISPISFFLKSCILRGV